MDTQPKIDEINVKILQALIRDARTDFTDIARDCGVSITTIAKRFQKLKRSGIIAGTALILNFKELRFKHGLSVDIKAEGGSEPTIIEAIKKLPNVRDCRKVIGKHDIHAAIVVESLDQIDQIRSFIKRQHGVLAIEITTSLDERHFYPENILITAKEDLKNG